MLTVVAGRALLWIAFALVICAASALFWGERTRRLWAYRAGRAALLGAWASAAAASALLIAALVGNNFGLRYAVEHSSRETPLIYRIGAFWGGQQGSLLLWLLVLLSYAAYLALRPPREGRAMLPYALAVLAAVGCFFAWMVAFVASPFVAMHPVPADGVGLNRLLRDPSFMLHPLAIYLGFVGFAVPFAFAAAGLLAGQTGDAWIRLTHRWGLMAWVFLSTGILLGANWSYHVLGWGGYWSFDPVEDAALLPWLCGTAFIHSAMVQERRGMLKFWNAALISGTYLLTVFATFLTRSGLLLSVHTFAESPIGGWLIGFVGVSTAGVVYLIGSHRDLLRDERSFDSLVSKEGSFLLNNIVFLGLMLTILFGVLLPFISPWLGTPLSVGEPYFDRVTAPLFTVLLLLAGAAPLLAWRHAGWDEFRRHLMAPVLAAAAFAFLLVSVGVTEPGVVVGMSAAFFTVVAVLYDFGLAVRARQTLLPGPAPAAAWGLVSRNPRRYGGYAVHVAVAIIALGVIGSHAFQRQATVALAPGQAVAVGGYDFQFQGLGMRPSDQGPATYARVAVFSGTRSLGVMMPAQEQGIDQATDVGPTPEIAIWHGLWRDLYVVLVGWSPGGGLASFNIYVNPMVSWIWLGGILLIFGTLWSLWPRPEVLAARRSDHIFGLWSELEYDWRMGKVARPEYLALSAQYRAMADEALEEERRAGQRASDVWEERIRERTVELLRGGAAAGHRL
jgi:cytochrome c-type biogenesis protein CcmF